MGYTTDFSGEFQLTPAANQEQIDYINLFSSTRRMTRDSSVLMTAFQGKHGLNGQYGTEGEFFCYNDNNFGQDEKTGVIDYNRPPSTQPSLWCQWILSEDGTSLQWDEGEKFYDYTEWLQYMIDKFFAPWNIKLNGVVKWQGESMDDRGLITVKDNVVTTTYLD